MLDKPKPKPDIDAAVAFLEAFRPGGPWNLTAIVPDGPITSATFRDPQKAKAWIGKHSLKANMHFTVNPAPKPSGKGGRVQKVDVHILEYRHADLDVDKLSADHELAALSLPQRKIAVGEDMDLSDLTPSLLIDSGGGLQGLWRLPSPIPATPENVELIESQNRWLAGQFAGGEPECANIDRLLRLPGTINHPSAKKLARGRTPVLAGLVSSIGEIHDAEKFGQVAAPSRIEADFDIGIPEVVTDLDALAAEYGLPERLVTIIREGRLPEPKQGDDTRSAWLFDATCGLARSGVPGEVIAGVLLNPEWAISASIFDHPGRPPEEQAVREAARALSALAASRQPDVDQLSAHPVDTSITGGPTGPQRHRFHLYSMRELRDAPLPVWLVQGLITEQSLVLIYGASKSFKTFTSQDIALCIATGRDFHGKAVRQGVVVYVAAEGHQAETYQRIRAWCIENGVSEDDLDSSFHLIITGAKLNNDEDRRELIQHLPAAVDIVFFDTLQRNMTGDESSTADASAVIRGVDEVRRVCQCAAVLVHHTGKSGDAERGSSVYRASADAIIKIKRERPHKGVKRSSLTADAMRAGPDGWSMGFEVVPVVTDPDTMTSTLVLRLVEEGTEVQVATAGMSAQEAAAQRARDAMLLEIWRTAPEKQSALEKAGRSKATVARYLAKLREDRLVELDTFKLTDDGIAHAEALDEIEKSGL